MTARYLKISGFHCLDPWPLYEAAQALHTPLNFWQSANSISCPLGFKPGSAFVVVDRAAANTICGPQKDSPQTLQWFTEAGATTFQGYYPYKAECVNIDGDELSAYLIELRDPRTIMRGAINVRFNVHKPLPYYIDDGADRNRAKYYADSLVGGATLYTNAEIWSAIWATLPGGFAEPPLPYALPVPIPKNFSFVGDSWEEAEKFLASIACTIAYDPITGTFSVIRLSAAQDGLAATLDSLSSVRIFDFRPKQAMNAARKPANWVFLNSQLHASNDDHNDLNKRNQVATGVSGAIGSQATNLAHPTNFCDSGGEYNAPYTENMASHIAVELTGKLALDEFGGTIYGGLRTILPGSQVSLVRWRDYGDGAGLVTELHQWPHEFPKFEKLNREVDRIVRCKLYDPLSKGGSALATIITYDHTESRWEPDLCGLTIWDSLEYAPDDGIQAGTDVFAKYHLDSEKWELLSVAGPPGIVRFRLYDNKLIGDTSTLATIMTFNGSDWVLTDEMIYLFDSYYPDPSFFTGTGGKDEGWAKLRKKAENEEDPDEYEVIWMSGPAHVIEFQLKANRSFSGTAELVAATCKRKYLYGNDGIAQEDEDIDVWFPLDYFPFAINGAKGTALYDDVNRRYVAVQCDQLCITATALLTADMCSFDAIVEDFTPDTDFPFSQSPSGVFNFGTGGGSGTVTNSKGHRGLAGDIVTLEFRGFAERYDVIDVSKKATLIGGPFSVDTADMKMKQFVYQIAAEYCTPPILNTVDLTDCYYY